MEHKVNALCLPQIKGHKILAFVIKGWRLPFDLFVDIFIHALDNIPDSLYLRLERVLKFPEKFSTLSVRLTGDPLFFSFLPALPCLKDHPFDFNASRRRPNALDPSHAVDPAPLR